MKESIEQSVREELLNLQLKKEQNVEAAQKIVLQYLEDLIAERDSATVAAMAEILKI